MRFIVCVTDSHIPIHWGNCMQLKKFCSAMYWCTANVCWRRCENCYCLCSNLNFKNLLFLLLYILEWSVICVWCEWCEKKRDLSFIIIIVSWGKKKKMYFDTKSQLSETVMMHNTNEFVNNCYFLLYLNKFNT